MEGHRLSTDRRLGHPLGWGGGLEVRNVHSLASLPLSLPLCPPPSLSLCRCQENYHLSLPGVPSHSFCNQQRYLIHSICLEKKKKNKTIPEKQTSRSVKHGQGARSGKDMEAHAWNWKTTVPHTGSMFFQPLWTCPAAPSSQPL